MRNFGVSGLIGVAGAPFSPCLTNFLRFLNRICFEISIYIYYLGNSGPGENSTEYKIIKNALEDISFAVNFAGIDFVEELH